MKRPTLKLSLLVGWLVMLCGAAWVKADEPSAKKKIVLVAGRASHGYGAHEHKAGCMLLAKALNENVPQVEAVVVTDGWPKDTSVFDNAASIAIYADGGGGHPFNSHIAEIQKLMDQGVGMVAIHYGVEVPKGDPGQAFLRWIGGYFETDWSVNPHWVANYKTFPEHEITRGVKPFSIQDEWYYHMRFPEKMAGVTPVLSDVPPENTLSRPDGPHSGNPAVRAEKGQPQHTAWAYERPNGGRGFGFTGGHDHWNWGNNSFRKLVLNAILWTAHVPVPTDGVPSPPLTVEDLMLNQDEPTPNDFNPARIQKMLDQWNGTKDSAQRGPGDKGISVTAVASAQPATPSAKLSPAPRPKFSSPLVTPSTPGQAVDIDVDITGAKDLYLVVDDGGDGFACDWADWIEPRLIGPKGELKLTDLEPRHMTSAFGKVHKNRTADGGTMRVAGGNVAYGFGTHANSVIGFDLPAGSGYSRFKARGGLDAAGVDQGCGSTVRFLVYTEALAVKDSAGATGNSAPGHEPPQALSGLEVADGVEAELFAAEPMLLSPSDIDVDHLGRVWVCEVVNYRGRNGQRPEGDRILILEDTDHDGKADKSTVFYQGRDIDSALGICVLGDKVIVSCAPNVFILSDENHDGKADRKDVLFTNVGQPQHDHSTHAFTFGPDGKLYWNVGNTGRAVHDKNGKIVKDVDGREVRDAGQPFRQGMAFRCNLDGSEFEVLGHNFRNNYEVAVDSFGTVWQSDNDDDGNRSVRINYVMEHGNFGYVDEASGAGWNQPRTNLETEVSARHWHQNDPGVVPNLLVTGAGSPTGICVYEGNLLPEGFRNQVIHCDAGPNIVRAYPVREQGAGYSAESLPLLEGKRDNWFRPSDVCVAPDGSLIIADWYDPGVGGHAMGDIDRGRIFRIAPPGAKYESPRVDLSTVDGALAALKSPNLDARYLGWTSLNKMGGQAEAGLKQMYEQDPNPRFRARALWLLTKLPEKGLSYAQGALKNTDANLRIVGLRAARELKADIVPLVQQVIRDPSPAVRREAALALRLCASPAAPALWAELATQYDGRDRWYLEALGIGAEQQWNAYLDAWLTRAGDGWNTLSGRDILWRSRASKTPSYLAKIIADPQVTREDLPRFFRAFDFLKDQPTEPVLIQLAFATPSSDAARESFVASEAVNRLGNFDVNKNPEQKAAIGRILDRSRNTPEFVALVGKFGLTDRYPELVTLAQQQPDSPAGIEAVRVLLARGQTDLLRRSIDGPDGQAAGNLVRALGNSADGNAYPLLQSILTDTQRPVEVRRQAVRGVAQNRNGATELIRMVRDGKVDEALKPAFAAALHSSSWKEIRAEADALFPPPPSKNDKPLPPLSKLAELRGNAEQGQKLYATTGTCNKCHIVNGEGKDIGPNLSEIGNKLSRQAFFESILYPSAGISHSYETYSVLLNNGTAVSGLLKSDTAESVTLRSNEGIDQTFKKSDIDEMKKQDISLMPADLQKALTQQDLVDIVEYLTTLKQARK